MTDPGIYIVGGQTKLSIRTVESEASIGYTIWNCKYIIIIVQLS